ncbi:hypothetical protein CL3_28750 [butyrate-producing bacterium SM4/1]|nr:hypothetical protein CL3_28750 [butyrate-producing bacterium SM4/1]
MPSSLLLIFLDNSLPIHQNRSKSDKFKARTEARPRAGCEGGRYAETRLLCTSLTKQED